MIVSIETIAKPALSITRKGNHMKILYIVLALAFTAAYFGGCSTQPASRSVYKESRFANSLEHLRFCQRHAPLESRCD
jgi:hypothetical protein